MARAKSKPVLLISILDPTGQEGLVRGAIVLNQFNKESLSVCTAIAHQNDIEIDNITWLSFEEIKRQLDAIGRRYWIDWVILSGIEDLNIASHVVAYLQRSCPGIKILWSPSVDKGEKDKAFNTQELALFQTITQGVFLTVCPVYYLKNALASQDIEALKKQLPEQSNFLLTNYTENQGAVVMTQNKTAIRPLSRSTAPAPLHYAPLLAALAAFLYEGLETEEACHRAFNFWESYPIN